MKITIETPQIFPIEEVDVSTLEGLNVLSDLFLEAAHWQRWMWSSFLGVKSVQFPFDYFMVEKTILKSKPDIIIETGSSFGGTTLFLASLLHILNKKGPVLSVDTAWNQELEESRNRAKGIALRRWKIPIHFAKGRSIDEDVLAYMREKIPQRKKVVAILDSNHARSYVFQELEAYAPLIPKGNHIMVCDTHCRMISHKFKIERKWDLKADPLGAVEDFLAERDDFAVDRGLGTYPVSTFNEGILIRIKSKK